MRRRIKYPLVVLAAGLVLVGASGVGATRAAMTYQTNGQAVDFSTATLSVELQEQQDGKYVSVDGKTTLPAGLLKVAVSQLTTNVDGTTDAVDGTFYFTNYIRNDGKYAVKIIKIVA